MRPAPFLLLFTVLQLLGCGTERDVTAPDSPVASLIQAGDGPTTSSHTFVVPLSSDCAQNASAIQNALNAAQPGDVVQLDAGTYCVSEGIVVLAGFDGTLRGAGRDITMIEAVRGPGGVPFHFDFDSDYIPGTAGIWPTVLHFEFPVDVTVTDLTFTESDPGHPGNYFQFIAMWGGDHTAVFEDLAFRGNPPSPERLLGVHAMAGSQAWSSDGKGTVLIRDVEINDVGDGIVPMWYGDGSTFRIEDIRTTRADFGVWGRGVSSGLEITRSIFNESGGGVFLGESSDARITGNTFTKSGRTGIFLREVRNVTISGNTIQEQHFAAFWHSGINLFNDVRNTTVTRNTFVDLSGDGGQAIFLWGFSSPVSENTVHHNTFTQSGLPGWNADTPSGPGAIYLAPNTVENEIFEMKYPAGTGKTQCQMVWDHTDDESTTEYDGANSIHGWEPCENLAQREVRKADTNFDPGFRRWYR